MLTMVFIVIASQSYIIQFKDHGSTYLLKFPSIECQAFTNAFFAPNEMHPGAYYFLSTISFYFRRGVVEFLRRTSTAQSKRPHGRRR